MDTGLVIDCLDLALTPSNITEALQIINYK